MITIAPGTLLRLMTASLCTWLVVSLYPVDTGRAGDNGPAFSTDGYRLADAGDIQRRQQQMKADIERKRAEQKQRMDAHRQASQPGQDQLRQSVQKHLSNDRSGATAAAAAPFNAATAPPPDECLKAFIATARNANSMEPVLNFLPLNVQSALKSRQSMYDPQQAAANRDSLRKRNPNLKEESLTHLSNPPYTNALKFYKGVANQIIDIQGVKIDGNKATLSVSTNSGATINGEHYGYGTADIELIGEGNLWRLSKYQSSIMVYKDLP
jgi:hypothetical protein